MATRVRLSICRNSGEQRGRVQGVVLVEATFEAIADAARKKLKLSSKYLKNLRLFVLRGPSTETIGFEIPRCTSDVTQFVVNDMVIAVSIGDDFIRPDGYREVLQSSVKFPRPPHFPKSTEVVRDPDDSATVNFNASNSSDCDACDRSAFSLSVESLVLPSTLFVSKRFAMNGEFPCLEGNVLPDIRDAIRDCSAFYIKDHGTFVAVDYRSNYLSDVFPNPSRAGKAGSQARWNAAVRRECRGLIINRSTGEVIARRFHKFFNIGELPETSETEVASLITQCLDAGEDLSLTKKIDGSLASPFLLPSTGALHGLHWALRTSENERLTAFVDGHPEHGFEALAREFLDAGVSPLFEWCDNQSGAVGVIHHEKQNLTLLSGRSHVDGSYVARRALEAACRRHSVPLVLQSPISTSLLEGGLKILQRKVTELEGEEEGVVLTLGAGGALGSFKLKSKWYVSQVAAANTKRPTFGDSGLERECNELHGILSRRPTLLGVPSRLVWAWALMTTSGGGGIDDTLSMCRVLLSNSSTDLAEMETFEGLVIKALGRVAIEFVEWGAAVDEHLSSADADELSPKVSRKKVIKEAAAIAVGQGWGSKLVAAAFRPIRLHHEIAAEVHSEFIRLAKCQRFDSLAALCGVAWISETARCSKLTNPTVTSGESETSRFSKQTSLTVTPGDGVELKSADLNRSSITTELLSLFHGTIVSGRGIEFIDQNIDDKDIEGSLRVIKNLLESEDPTTDEGICIVLRGLPGSGKSTLASMFLNKAENGMIVSADHYFEQGAGVLSGKAKKGLSTEEIYDRCFDQSRQAKAHQHCREEFTRALVSKASPVLVDNTNVERREYAHYERTATISGYKVIVIEVARAEICCTKQDVIRRGAEIDNAKTRRDELGNGGDSGGGGFGIHHVPYSVVFRMQSRWENDSRAVRLQFWKGRIQSKRASTDSP